MSKQNRSNNRTSTGIKLVLSLLLVATLITSQLRTDAFAQSKKANIASAKVAPTLSISPEAGCTGLYCDKGYFDWRGGFSSKHTDFVQSTDRGWVCVASDLDSYNLSNTSYRWKIQEWTSAGWWDVRTSDRFNANGNDDVQCFDRDIEPRRFYRAKFGLLLPGGFVHGHYTIRGFYSKNGPIQ